MLSHGPGFRSLYSQREIHFDAVYADLLDRGTTVIPALSDGRVERMWSGLRPFCEDGLPVIGRVPGWENVSVAAGHFTMGITGSPITAKIIKELIVDGHWDRSMEIFSPARFVDG